MEPTETAPDEVNPTAGDSEHQAELKLAIAELAFWLDFAKWWRSKYCNQEEPRIAELLAQAEQRYLHAKSDAVTRDNVHDIGLAASSHVSSAKSVE